MTLTHQQIFDKALSGVRQQGGPSRADNGGLCAYRGADGRKCGVGHLIDDAHYSPTIESLGVQVVHETSVALSPGDQGFGGAKKLAAALQASGVSTDKATVDLMKKIQRAHDGAAVYDNGFMEAFNRNMQHVADEYGLTYTEAA